MLAENLQHWAEKERLAGEQTGIKKGSEKTKLKMVLGMIALGSSITDEQIAKVSGFSLEDIAALRKSSGH